MKQLKLIISLVIFFISAEAVRAQDIHFSQFHRSPFNLNPALAGNFDGDYRITANQRSQWRSVTTPYNTFGIAGDAKNLLKTQPVNGAISIYNDKAGDSKLRTFKLNLAGSYAYALSSDSSQFLNFGLQTGFTQLSINYNDLSFDNQYINQSYQPGAANGEIFDRNSRTYLNLNAGINWTYTIDEKKKVNAGLGLFNITKPKQTFYTDEEVRLDRRLNFHAGGEFYVNDDIDAMPAILFMSQGKFKEFIFGSEGRYTLNETPGEYRAIFAGLWYRNRDAGFISAGMEYNNITVGVSYDINVSGLVPASRYRGGLEFSLIYIFRTYKPDIKTYKACPNYI